MKKRFFSLLIFWNLSLVPLCGTEGDNKIIVCDNGVEMLQWDLQFLRSAKQSVEILACFFGGEVARDTLAAVEARLAEVPALQVYILATPILIQKDHWVVINRLQQRYPNNFHLQLSTQVVKLLPDITSIDNHVKMFVVDETYFSAGGTNLDEAHCAEGTTTPSRKRYDNAEVNAMLPSGMRDQDIVGRGTLAKDLRIIFYQLYSIWEYYNSTHLLETDPEKFKEQHYFEVTEHAHIESFETAERLVDLRNNQVKAILGGPFQSNNEITQEYVRQINNAKEEIRIANLYFFPIQPIFNALMNAVCRGVKITIITNGCCETSPRATQLFCWGSRLSYVPMFYGNTFHFWDALRVRAMPVKQTEIFEYDVPDVLLHKKMMLVDQKIFLVGSYNMGMKSAYGDYELLLVFQSDQIAQAALSVHKKDLLYTRQITPAQACDWYFDPIISSLGEMQRKFNGFL